MQNGKKSLTLKTAEYILSASLTKELSFLLKKTINTAFKLLFNTNNFVLYHYKYIGYLLGNNFYNIKKSVGCAMF